MLDDDPLPREPVAPSLDDCCCTGCVLCVFDAYQMALEKYELALAAWKERHSGPPQHPQTNSS